MTTTRPTELRRGMTMAPTRLASESADVTVQSARDAVAAGQAALADRVRELDEGRRGDVREVGDDDEPGSLVERPAEVARPEGGVVAPPLQREDRGAVQERVERLFGVDVGVEVEAPAAPDDRQSKQVRAHHGARGRVVDRSHLRKGLADERPRVRVVAAVLLRIYVMDDLAYLSSELYLPDDKFGLHQRIDRVVGRTVGLAFLVRPLAGRIIRTNVSQGRGQSITRNR